MPDDYAHGAERKYLRQSRRDIMILERFFPDEQMPTVYQLDFGKLYEEGYRGLIFDIDNTLVPHGADADQRARDLFRRLEALGFRSCLLSNNKEERVRRFNREIHTDYIYKAGKPGKKGYCRAMEKMGTKLSNTVFIGDQLFTDVWGAKRIGMRNILVEPISPKEEIQIVLKRRLEWIVLYFWRRRKNAGGCGVADRAQAADHAVFSGSGRKNWRKPGENHRL